MNCSSNPSGNTPASDKIGLIAGAVPIGKEKSQLISLLKSENTYKIAADGGIGIFIETGIAPDQWIGDMDSTEELLNQNPVLSENCKNPVFDKILKTVVPHVKDDTDMALCVEKVFEAGCTEALIFGGIGGSRSSHFFANIQLLHKYAIAGKKITMISENSRIFVLHNSSVSYPADKTGYISVFALDKTAEDVKIEGLFYEFQGNLTNQNPLGVSNEFIGKPSEISVKNGSLLIMEEEK